MKNKDLKKLLAQDVPEVPERFHNAMQSTLDGIVRDALESPAVSPGRRGGFKRGSAVLVFAAVLLIASVAVAVGLQANVFSMFWGEQAPMSENAEGLIQRDLVTETFGNFQVSIKEAAYDGASLYVVYSVRDMTATEPLSNEPIVFRGKAQEGLFNVDDAGSFGTYHGWPVGWWFDAIWINGQDTDMPSGSTGMSYGTSTPGELLCYQLYRLDQEGVYLHGKTRITMPIGEVQPFDILERNEDRTLKEPTKGVVSFTLDCDHQPGVTHLEPNIDATFPDGTVARVSVAHITPIKFYLDITYDVPEALVDAYKAEHGEGIADENGNVVFPWDASAVVESWVYSMQIVDKQGKPVYEESDYSIYDGCNGYGASFATYMFPYKESYPDEMYIAPVKDGVGDMTHAIRIR